MDGHSLFRISGQKRGRDNKELRGKVGAKRSRRRYGVVICSPSSYSEERKKVPELHRINEGQAEWIIISLALSSLSLYISVVFSAFASAN